MEQYISMTKQAKKLIVIDGCPVACGKKIMEHNNFYDYKYLMVTEEGIEKVPGKSITPDEINKIKSAVESIISG